jgi:outer membrane protein TolC
VHRLPLRKSHRWRVHLLWVVLVSSGSASASPEVLELTWPDVVRLAEAQPRLAADQLHVAAARWGIDAAGAVPNPTFEADLGRGRARIGDESRTESELALSIPLGWIAERGPKLEAAGAEVDAALAESLASRREVLLQLRALFWGLAYEQARVGVLETLEAQTTKLAQTVRRRVETGEVRPVEAPLVEIELEKVAAELETARTLLLARQTALARWLAVPPDRTLVAKADLAALPDVLDRETALARARSADPALRIASARSRLL